MAEPVYPWCLSAEQSPEDRRRAADLLLSEIENVHRQVSTAEWAEITRPMNLADHADEYPALSGLTERPEYATTGPWWNLTNPNSWIEVKEQIFSPTSESANRTRVDLAAYYLRFDETRQFNKQQKDSSELYEDFLNALNEYKQAHGQYLEDIQASLDEEKAEQTLESIKNIKQSMIAGLAKISERGRVEDREYVQFMEGVLINRGDVAEEHEKYKESRENLEDFCPSLEDIKQLYQNALLELAQPEIAKKEERVSKLQEKLKGGTGDLTDTTELEDLQNDLQELKEGIKGIVEGKVTAATVEAIATEAVFREQCFIIANLPEFVNARKKQDEIVGLPYALDNYNTPELIEKLEKSPRLKNEIDSNKPINIEGSPFAFINKLTVNPNQAALFDLREEQLSSLTPRIRLFKSEFNKETKKEEEIEIKFDTNVGSTSSGASEINQFLSRPSAGGRGLGVGLKNFTFAYDGTDPFSAKKAISAKLDLYAPSFSDLLRERQGVTKDGVKKKYKFVDLALKTGGNLSDSKKQKLSETEKDNLDKLNFRIRVMIEFAASKDVLRTFRPEQSGYTNVLKNAVYDSAISIYLTPTIHEFNFDDAGGVEFSINYLAYIEDYFNQEKFDIFTELSQLKEARNLVLQYFREEKCNEKEGYEKFKTEDQQFVERTNTQALNKIIRELFSSQKVYYINLSDRLIREFFREPFSFEVNLKKQSLKNLEEDAIAAMKSVIEPTLGESSDVTEEEAAGTEGKKRKILAGLVAYSENNTKVPFMYLNDIISTVMRMINDRLKHDYENNAGILGNSNVENYISQIASSLTSTEALKEELKDKSNSDVFFRAVRAYHAYTQMRVVLGPAEIGLGENKYINCALGDIPISINYFIDFMSEKLLSKNLSSYSLSKFIKDLITDCVKNFVNEDTCYKVNLGTKLKLNSTTVLAYDTSNNKYTEDNLSDLIAIQMRVKKDGKAIANREILNIEALGPKNFPVLKVSGPRDDPRKFLEFDKMRNYYIFSASRAYPSNLFLGNRAVDAKNGIFHYILGEDKGMLKTISLDKTSTPGLKELRFEQEGFAGLEQLREVYNANVSTFLNVQSFPGTYIYIEPNGFDPTATEDLSRFGIGGYYMITKTRHTIQPGNAETEINAAWVASRGTYIRSEEDGSEEEKRGSERQPKCAATFRS